MKYEWECSNFKFSPLSMICIKIILVSIINLRSILCVYSMNEIILSFFVLLILHGINEILLVSVMKLGSLRFLLFFFFYNSIYNFLSFVLPALSFVCMNAVFLCLCIMNENILVFKLTPLSITCIKVLIKSLIKLGYMRCLWRMKNFVVYSINGNSYGISHKTRLTSFSFQYKLVFC